MTPTALITQSAPSIASTTSASSAGSTSSTVHPTSGVHTRPRSANERERTVARTRSPSFLDRTSTTIDPSMPEAPNTTMSLMTVGPQRSSTCHGSQYLESYLMSSAWLSSRLAVEKYMSLVS